jgi:hypothetical protein
LPHGQEPKPPNLIVRGIYKLAATRPQPKTWRRGIRVPAFLQCAVVIPLPAAKLITVMLGAP